MEQVIIISDGEEEMGARPRKRRRRAGTSCSPATADLIDLTEEDFNVDRRHSDGGVIDLTNLEGLEDMQDRSGSRTESDGELYQSEEDCMFIKSEESSKVSSLHGVREQTNSSPELDLFKSGTSSEFNSSTSNSLEDCFKSRDRLSDNGTAASSDLGSLDNIDLVAPSNMYSSSSKSSFTSLGSLSDDLQDSSSKSSFTASPAVQEDGREMKSLLYRRDSFENPPHCSKMFHSDSLDNHILLSSRESSDERPLLETSFHCSSRESHNGSSLGNLPSLSNDSPLSASVENSPHVPSRESCDGRLSLENLSPYRSNSCVTGPLLESSLHPSSRELHESRPSPQTPHLFSSIEFSDRNASLETFQFLFNRESRHPSLPPANSLHVSRRESCDSRQTCLPNISTFFRKESWDSKHSPNNVTLMCSTASSNSRPNLGIPTMTREPSSSVSQECNTLHNPHLTSSPSLGFVVVEPHDPSRTTVPQLSPSAANKVDSERSLDAADTPVVASRAWLNKLKYFRKLPIQHIFFQGLKLDAETIKNRQRPPVPISDRRLNMVATTIEEEFSQGTLQFLMDFVTPQHYPPKEYVSHVVRKILLSSKDIDMDMLMEAYDVLMKIQQFHPASLYTLSWDWDLLTKVMEKKDEELPGRFLFLRYVLQTLQDDFQTNLVRRTLQKSITKAVLSCDLHFSNVRDVIQWLMNAVTFCPSEAEPESIPSLWADVPRNKKQMVACIFQQMLSMAVEVDKSPTISSNKIAEALFLYVPSIPERSQRETFFNTMMSELLRGKLLEVMFNHSCKTPPTGSLSRTKILYFIKHSELLLEDKGGNGESERWDEMLHYLYLLFISYESIVFEHLRTPLTERVDLKIQKAKVPLMEDDIISKLDVDQHLDAFGGRISKGHEEVGDAQILERMQVLRTVLYTTIQYPAPKFSVAANGLE
ncbi:SUMO-interacting motif-containing protein 1 isoform X2 [Ambystoma mexicanum]|uniref:SUMO-interacting motif-containing protein 1 isoform X2 n=1 Tax=Ambystoma mexicanum TaxID=8296 RepID=UPI0037E909B7